MFFYDEITTVVAALATLLWLCFGPLNRLRCERFRSDIRALRDGLFDFVWKNGLSFDDPAYREYRDSLNSILRASNVLSPVYFVLTAVKSPTVPNAAPLSTQPKLQAQIEAVRVKVAERTVRFIFGEGVTGWCLFVVVAVLRSFRLVASTSQMGAKSIAGLEFLARQDALPRRYCLPRV